MQEQTVNPGTTSEVVATLGGTSVLGRVLTSGPTAVACWMNLPYARPAQGALRLQPPQRLPLAAQNHWDGRSPQAVVAPQLPSRLREAMGDFAAQQSEDCLRLSIWAPLAALQDGRPRPVLAWLHGGAWISGGAAISWYDGQRWAEEADIVVVGINYRLGALGWLVGDEPTHSNLGLQDSALALEWVAEHIPAFGGDPSRITLMGQSAGGDNIGALMQASGPLPFQQVIVQSAPIGRELRTLDEAHAVREMVMRQWGLQRLEQLRELPLPALLQGQAHAEVQAQMKAQGIAGQVYTVVADGLHVSAQGRARYMESAARMPSIIGATREEMTAFPGMTRSEPDLALGRKMFNDGALRWQQQAHAAGQSCWQYEFQYGPNPRFGACHCIDLPFSFGTLAAFDQAPMLAGGEPAAMEELSTRWRRSLQQFVRGGAPDWAQNELHICGSNPLTHQEHS